ncbi:N-acetylmuramoyl-L-alanine amidase [Bacillus sp. SLBN-46]|uniref:N-acetylmuramoyl-L-alanine amidase family protein n=1 Tax=Bacillus sp. SLBN-46 TaxID=3042283 RepID=UPI00285B4935|nr:N-acetylmuramoyl-L-alanine amidase [Bacillus sp. SLBN-46]MDR6121530.1 N-acetylmuramoyl-L-alanine amidase [Bacillus sp. SLBN-46]
MNNTWYYLASDFSMSTGWVRDGGKWYYLDNQGQMQTGWVLDSNKKYYLNGSGAMQTGWLKLDGKRFYLNQTGAMVTGWFQDKGLWYYFDTNGIMQTGWVTVNNEKFFLDPNGVWVPITNDLNGKTIIIDPGHGGYDSGANAEGVYEKNINLQVSLKFADALRSHGATVYMTRSKDEFISLDNRVIYSNSIKPDAFISIHVNSSTSTSASGIETYHNSEDGVMPVESKQLATLLQNELIKATGAFSRGIKDESFRVIRDNEAPAVLVEIGFVSNSTERANLTTDTYQNKLVTGLINGVLKFFNL